MEIISLRISSLSFRSFAVSLCAASVAVSTAPASAQEGFNADAFITDEGGSANDSVYDENWLSVGIAAAVLPTYEGSDDYTVAPVPLMQGKLGPVHINPRPAGLALDFLPKSGAGVQFSAGLNFRYRANRNGDVGDEVVQLASEVGRAFEVGPTVGVNIPGVMHAQDSLTINLDARWDVAGAHDGFVVVPSATYFTPLSRATALSLTVGAKFVDDNFADTYFSVDAANAFATGLPVFEASGGLKNLNSTLLLGLDLNGNFEDGGAAVFVAGGYTRFQEDAAASPFTSTRGSANQFVGAVGVGYTF